MPENGDGEKEKKEKERKELMQKLAVYLGIPWYMVSGLLIGYIAGHFLEKKFPSNNIILVICLLIGFIAGAVQVYETIKKIN